MQRKLFCTVLLVLFILVSVQPIPVRALRGIPGSTEFGYGAQLNIGGTFATDGIKLSSNLSLDWLGLEIPWATLSPKSGGIDWSRIDPLLQAAERSQVSVMVSLTTPPAWAVTPQGPDPALTAQFVVQLVQRFPKAVRAVELFPGANIRQNWAAQPNPGAYVKVLNAVSNAQQKLNCSAILIAGGLLPVPANLTSMDQMDDLAFLQGLYSAGLRGGANIISVQAATLTGEPLLNSQKTENRVLRHYEEIRQVMLKNQHENGLIWITHLSPPDGSISASDAQYRESSAQIQWLNQAFNQLKSQLYIGVAFLNSLNPTPDGLSPVELIQPDGSYHPFYRSFRDLVYNQRAEATFIRPGRAKDQPLQKNLK